MSEDQALRDHVVKLLRGGQAYEPFEAIVGNIPARARGTVPKGAERSAWQILDHIRIAQRDILDFCRNEDGSYVELNWPLDYWPRSANPPDDQTWKASAASYLADRAALEALVLDPQRDLFRPFPWGTGQTLLRETLLAADHASYHLGQLVIVYRLLGA